ncbi:AAC(3) family N-acetyltransferase [Thermodesulfobacteriota bacterium]
MKRKYTYNDILEAYRSLGITKGSIVSLKTDLRWLGPFEHPDPAMILNAHFDALCELVDLAVGTIVVPTGCTSLCNTDKIFNPDETPSEVGALTEFIRKQQGAVRSFHPFVSYAAIGKDAEAICGDAARHAFGPETPHKRLVDMNALEISIGLHPMKTCSLVHHIELVMGVPYRYVKEFVHPVLRDGILRREPFYMYVWYRDCDIFRDDNKKIFDHFIKSGNKIKQASLGSGNIYSYQLASFYKSTIQLFKQDIYAWLEREPTKKPYQK